jgi:hypothetical protein
LASIKSFLEMQKISLEKNKNLTEKFLNKKWRIFWKWNLQNFWIKFELTSLFPAESAELKLVEVNPFLKRAKSNVW